MQVGEYGRDLVEVNVEEDVARRETEAVEDVGELDAGERKAVALGRKLASSTSDEFLRETVSGRNPDDANARLTSRGMLFPAIRCMRSGTLPMISLAFAMSLPSS